MSDDTEEFTSILDSPEMIELAKENLRRNKFRDTTTTNSEQLRRFLEICNRRGSPYRRGVDLFPRLKQLAKYCGCDASTIYRIMTGEQKSMKTNVSDILLAISCICPKPTLRISRNIANEQRRRLADADAWVKSDRRTRGDILTHLLDQIKKRERRREQKRAQRAGTAKP